MPVYLPDRYNSRMLDDEGYIETEELLFDMTAEIESIYGLAYEEMLVTESSEDYKIIIKGKDGYAAVAYTTYDDGTKEPTLPITIGGYDLYFYANN